ncbi:hypothetical protein ART_0174 [Arthrobacter sp. PAMC 25486]|uniref:hypothetical protein n=1 Tax=Arthrobacter sp. PAMC 25486 TaxID=1494608 RepID=UPI000535A495|nr:hypothetical protein [Arthrobacter sp. PAMC 25486]AIX99772.1 hypothetical protein ART_0174 [Arthrobacter sp. PAMC 25486]
MTEITEETFDLEAWIGGATTKERRVTVYQKSGLIGQIDILKEELTIARRIPTGQRGISDRSPAKIEAEIRTLAQSFADSALVVRVKGLTEDHSSRLRKNAVVDAEKNRRKLSDEARSALGMRAVLLESIVFPKFTDEKQLKTFAEAIGDGQYVQIIEAYQDASFMPSEVNPGFLLESSDEEDGADSYSG